MILNKDGDSTQAKKELKDDFQYNLEQFADISILRYKVEGFEDLNPRQKEMIYYLSQSALAGRDIFFDQNCEWNLPIRRTLEIIYTTYSGDKDSTEFKNLEEYLKKIWFANGIHHHYSTDKFTPKFTIEFFTSEVKKITSELLPLKENQTVNEFLETIIPVIFDKNILNKRVNQSAEEDLIITSASNYYNGVNQKEAEDFYEKLKDTKDNQPISHGLNSQLTKINGNIVERIWKIGGMYSDALKQSVYWLEKARDVAENKTQRNYIEKLIEFNNTGNLHTFDEYSVLWVQDTFSDIDFINGFTETYGDPLGIKASWESLINFKNTEATKRTVLISDNAQWFEDNSPIDIRFKKETVKGVSAKVINVAMLGGDCYPATPIGVNLPNADWIRRDHGSKSVTIENITNAYDKASQGSGFGKEFIWDDYERELIKEHGFSTDNLHTDLHECLGHGSGKLLDGVSSDALKAYGASLEETRADLFGLYYMADNKIVELGLLPNNDAYKAQYYKYLLNGLMTQLTRIELGKDIEQAHMRNRQLISRWVLEQGEKENILELKVKDNKTYLIVNNYPALRELFGRLLAEVQRIKSEGDFKAGKELIEKYAVKIDPEIHKEIIDRNNALNISPYKGFVNPSYKPTFDKNGIMTTVEVDYSEGYTEQNLRYSKEYSFLPSYNNIT